MVNEEKDESRGFKVADRRRFTESGEARANAPDPAEEAPVAPPQPTAQPPAASEDLEITFSTFVISLSTQALAHLGEIPNPVDRQTAVDLSAARQMIDILGVLRDKTRGNLDAEEQALLDHVLYDLRMRYVEAARRR